MICGVGVKAKKKYREIKGTKRRRKERKTEKESKKKERKLPCVFTNPLNLLLSFYPALDHLIYNQV